jgi:acyl-CoA synthetase (NDP forming)
LTAILLGIANVFVRPRVKSRVISGIGYGACLYDGPMEKHVSGLDNFFDPDGIAIVGASAAEGRPGRVVIENLMTNGFAGKIYPVNPRGGEILGHKVYPTIGDIPDAVHMAVCMLPAGATAQAVRDCAAKGIKSVVLAAGGFAEIDAGEDLQAELAAVVKDTGIRILGPNTAGHISTPANFTTSFFPLGEIPAGPISYIAQTGNFTGAMMRHIMTAENYGVARCIGLGNAVDIDEADVLEYLADDDRTGTVFAYLEDLKHPKRFLDIASEMTRKKPLIVLKGGATAEGAKAAQSHTASLGADDRVLDGAFRQAGIVRINEFSQLFTVAKAAAFMPPPKGNRVGFVSPSGAFIVHTRDLCRQRLNLEFPEFQPATLARLKEISPPIVNISNPVDVFPSVTVHGLEFAWSIRSASPSWILLLIWPDAIRKNRFMFPSAAMTGAMLKPRLFWSPGACPHFHASRIRFTPLMSWPGAARR